MGPSTCLLVAVIEEGYRAAVIILQHLQGISRVGMSWSSHHGKPVSQMGWLLGLPAITRVRTCRFELHCAQYRTKTNEVQVSLEIA